MHHHHVGGVDGHVGAGADGDAHRGPLQGGGVVDAVPHHGHGAACQQTADHRLLAVGQYPGDDLVHPGLPADGIGRARIVAGEHHHTDAHVLQLSHRLGGVGFDGVRHGDQAQNGVIFPEIQGRFALFGQRLPLCQQGGGEGELAAHEFPGAAPEGFPVPPGGEAAAGEHGKVGDGGEGHGLFGGIGHHRCRQRVLGMLLQIGGQLQQGLCRHAGGRHHVGDHRRAGGDGAGLVQHHRVHLPGVFQRHGGFEEDAVFGAHAIAHHNGHRGGKAQGAGAGDHQHGDGPGDGESEVPAREQPDLQRHHRDTDHRRDEHGGHLVGNSGNGGLGGGGVGHHADDLGKGGVLPHPCGPAAEIPGGVDSGGGDGVPRPLVHRDGLAGEGRLVDGAVALQNHAVHRDGLTGPHGEGVAHGHLADGNRYLLPLPHQNGGLGRQAHQTLQGVGGAAFADGFQQLAESNQRGDHSRRLKVQVVAQGHDGALVAPAHGPRHGEQLHQTVPKGGAAAQGHQRVHVGGPVK